MKYFFFVFFIPLFANAESLTVSAILECARQTHLIGANEDSSCFAAAEEADGSLGLVETCGLGGDENTRAFFSQSNGRNGYKIAPDYIWRACP